MKKNLISTIGTLLFSVGRKALMTLPLLLFSVTFGFSQILSESFDVSGLPAGWSQEYVNNSKDWSISSSNNNGTITPHSGASMAEFRPSYYGSATKLITPSLDLSAVNAPELTFYFANVGWYGDIDELRVYYKTSATGTWTQIGNDYTTEHSTWEKMVFILPNPSGDYYVAFEATDMDGRGLNLDDVSIISLPPCTGTPDAGTVTDMIVCPNIDFTLTSVGASTSAIGLTKTWESSTDNVTFTSIVGSENDTYTVVGGAATTMYYRYILTCNGTDADTSAVVTVTMKGVNECPCIPVFDYGCSDDMIDDFSLLGENSTSIIDLSTGCAGGYDDRTSIPAVDLLQSNTYTADILTHEYDDNFAIWIDFNDNGDFESTELVGTYTGSIGGTISSVSLSIPTNATTGLHRMRVIVGYDEDQLTFDPCNTPGNIEYGEAHDYMVNILALTNCTGTPNAGTVTDIIVCPNIDFTLTSVGASTSAIGLTKTWESSTDNVTFTSIVGSENDTYTVIGGAATTMYYRYILTCNGTDADTSAVVTVTMKGVNECPCIPVFDYGCSDDMIDDFSLFGENSTSIIDLSTGCAGGYDDRTSIPAVDLLQSNTYTADILTHEDNDNFAIWIDFNDNGDFESTELVGTYTGSIGGTISSVSLSIPTNATTGLHRMRVIVGYDEDPLTFDPCNTPENIEYGEAHDYMVNILCGTPLVVNLGADDAYCIGTTYSATLDAENVGATYLWSDNSTNQTLSISTAGTYSVTVTDANNCITKDTITITENTLPIVNLGVDTIYCAGSSMTLDAGNVGSNYLWNDNSINQTLSVSTAGTYSVTVTDANGCESADTIVLSAGAILTAGNLTSSASSNCSFDFGITGVSNVDSYAWNFGDGSTETTTTAFASHTFVNEGDYTVTVTLSNECGTETKQIIITCDKTGVNDVASEKRLTLYPNPTSTNITIENSGNLNMEVITIIDNLGKVVYHATPMITMDYQLNVSHLSNGLYTVLVKTDKGVITKKIEVLK